MKNTVNPSGVDWGYDVSKRNNHAIHALDVIRNQHRYDVSGWKHSQTSLACRSCCPSLLARMDCLFEELRVLATKPCVVDCVCSKPHQVETTRNQETMNQYLINLLALIMTISLFVFVFGYAANGKIPHPKFLSAKKFVAVNGWVAVFSLAIFIIATSALIFLIAWIPLFIFAALWSFKIKE